MKGIEKKNQGRAPYSKPRLVTYGNVKHLTQAGGHTTGDGGTTKSKSK